MRGYGSGTTLGNQLVNETERCPGSETKAYIGAYCLSCSDDRPLRADGRFRVHTRLTARAKAARQAARTDIENCTCVMDCSGPDRCSLSGEFHVHPKDALGLFGACPLHPEAPGDL